MSWCIISAQGPHALPFQAVLPGLLHVTTDGTIGLPCSFDEPWLHPELCPFNAGPHWLGGYNGIIAGEANPASGQSVRADQEMPIQILQLLSQRLL